jgi:hypothetical protein
MLKKAARHLQKLDVFGKQVSLTYQGEERFKTLIGGIMTVLLAVIMFVFFLYFLIHDESKTIGTISTMTTKKPIEESNEIDSTFNPFKYGFNVGVRHFTSLDNPNTEVEFWLQKSTQSDTEFIKLQSKACTGSDFPTFAETAYAEKLEMGEYTCLSSTENLDLYTSMLASNVDRHYLLVYLKS